MQRLKKFGCHEKNTMRFFFPLLFLFFVSASCKKGSNQENTSSLCLKTEFVQTNISDAFLSIFFLNGKDGFVSGYYGGIYKTTDSAKTWSFLYSGVNLPVQGLFFINELKGFAVGGQTSCGGSGCIPPGGFILGTLDGGQSWTRVFTPTDKVEITSVYFVNDLTGFCAGDNIIFKTTDGGQTWNEYKVNNLGGKMRQIYFVNSQKGFVLCTAGKILKTENGGLSWEITNPLQNTGYYSMSASNGSTYISGQRKIIKSVNGGNSWTELPNSPDDIFALHFINAKTGFAFG
jgi:photosystem II stability/assembly factor-like uncharacterized protein